MTVWYAAKKQQQMMRLVFSLLVFSAIIFFADACKKKPVVTDPEVLELRSNVRIISTTGLVLNLAASNLPGGVYVYQNFGSNPRIQVGDILVSGDGDGYIRKVTSITINGNTYTFNTTQGTLEDVFKKGHLIFDFDLNFIVAGKNAGIVDTILERNIYQSTDLNVLMRSAQLRYAPVFNFVFLFDSSGLNTFDLSTKNASYSSTVWARVDAAQEVPLQNRTDTLRKYTKIAVKWNLVSGFPTPVVVRLDLYWLAQYSISTATPVSNTFLTTSMGNQSFNAGFAAGQWDSDHTFNPTLNMTTTQPPATNNVAVNMTCRPVLAFKIMGVPGPLTTTGLTSDIASRVATGSGDWDLTGQAFNETTLGINTTVFSSKIPSFPEEKWETGKTSFNTPHQIVKASVDSVRTPEKQPLANPVRVRVLDSKGTPARNVPVYFNIATGNGSVNPATTMTDQNGYAQTSWRLGDRLVPMQKMEARAKRGDLSEIVNSPLTFTAYVDTPVSCGSATDVDGNSYAAVIIGGKCWFTRNLSSKRYANNTSIAPAQDSLSWLNAGGSSLPAWCNYRGDDVYGRDFGRSYNWYAANNPANICPAGWHVATLADWQSMIDSLGGNAVAGTKLKLDLVSNETWEAPLVANNISGFSAIAVGFREQLSTDFWEGGLTETVFWTSTQANSLNGYAVRLRNDAAGVTITPYPKTRGYNVRCVKN